MERVSPTEDFVIWQPHEAFYINAMLFNTTQALKAAKNIEICYFQNQGQHRESAPVGIGYFRLPKRGSEHRDTCRSTVQVLLANRQALQEKGGDIFGADFTLPLVAH